MRTEAIDAYSGIILETSQTGGRYILTALLIAQELIEAFERRTDVLEEHLAAVRAQDD